MKKIMTVITIVIIIFFIIRSWWDSQLAPVSSDKTTQVFVVTRGAGVSDVAKKLRSNGLIKSELAFKIYIRQKNLTNKLQAGSYKLSPFMSAQEILNTLQSGSEDIWVTLIEGWRVEEMAEELSSKFKVQSSKFLKLAEEGYMFPDTYLFSKDATEEQIVQRLRSTFDARFAPELRSKIRSQGLSEAEGVVLASIVEREARSDQARKEIAGILLKRLKIGMGLNADATLQYALVPKGSENPPAGGWWKRHLSRDDLGVDSPYNTYIHAGLPPTPICNPGPSSLEAVANADPDTPYLYYYHDSKGISHYAKTLDEHNQNIVNFP